MGSETGSLAIDLRALDQLPWHQRRIIDHLVRLREGTIKVTFTRGGTFPIHGSDSGPECDITIHRPAALLRRLFWRGDLGFGESFIAGDWDSSQPARLLEVLARNLDAFAQADSRHPLMRLMVRLQHRLNRNSRSGSRRNIAAHYDLGNDFYARWLDQSMTYSAALFDEPGLSLAQAQERKYARMLAQIDPQHGDRILEIGCGWGGFAEYAARRGHRVVGLTLSQEQLAYARARLDRAGLAERADFRLCDYRDFDERVDHVVSIEMFEAVGQDYWQTYFATLSRCLAPGGRAALQVITIAERLFEQYAANPGGFIQTYIFPGGMLPTKTHLGELAARAGLKPRGAMHAFGIDYADTLAQWHTTFDRATDWLEQRGYDARFRRMWRYYLAFCEAGFRAGDIDVVQFGMQKA
jgi:cyclopropane-fatty-acyl-phospholipid synthase